MNNRLRSRDKVKRPPDTINDIAAELGLSKTTISRVLSGTGRISEQTRERVLAHIKNRGFHPSHIAKSLAVSKTFNIAVVLPADAEIGEIPFFQACLHSVTETANERDYDVIVSVSTGQNVVGLRRLVKNQKIDGVILTRPLYEDRSVDFLREASLPFVVIGSKSEDSLVQVDSDHAGGCREVTARVIAAGSRRLSLLAGNPGHQVNKDRYSGFLAALADAGLAPGDCPVAWDSGGGASFDRAMEKAMRGGPDCLLCMDDAICGRALAWLQRKGRRVPEDVRIASFHDSPFMEMHNPSITALHIDVRELGSVAAQALLDMVSGKAVPSMNRVGYKVIVRESSRPV